MGPRRDVGDGMKGQLRRSIEQYRATHARFLRLTKYWLGKVAAQKKHKACPRPNMNPYRPKGEVSRAVNTGRACERLTSVTMRPATLLEQLPARMGPRPARMEPAMATRRCERVEKSSDRRLGRVKQEERRHKNARFRRPQLAVRWG